MFYCLTTISCSKLVQSMVVLGGDGGEWGEGGRDSICRQQFLLEILYNAASCFLHGLYLFIVLKSVGFRGLTSLLALIPSPPPPPRPPSVTVAGAVSHDDLSAKEIVDQMTSRRQCDIQYGQLRHTLLRNKLPRAERELDMRSAAECLKSQDPFVRERSVLCLERILIQHRTLRSADLKKVER